MGSIAENAKDLIRIRHDGRMMALSDEARVLRFFLKDQSVSEIAERTGHACTTIIDVLARYRHANGDPLRKSKKNGDVPATRPLMEGVDYPDRASPYANLFVAREIQPVDLEKNGRWQDRMVYG